MRVGIIQSNYIPWRGYFDLIDQVDLFVIYDDVQYTKGGWRNRNRIKTPAGVVWLSVPVKHQSISQLICETRIDYATDWQRYHLDRFKENYAKSPYFEDAIRLLEEAFHYRDLTISELNVRLISLVCAYLGIKTPMRFSAEFSPKGTKTERVFNLLRSAGATIYLSGPTARDYLDERPFRESGMGLEYKSYEYGPYPQLLGKFEGAVTILDLIANCGPGAKHMLTSLTPNQAVVP